MLMIEARKREHDMPLRESLAAPAPQGALSAFWLGQAGFALRTAESLVVIDPYLSDALAEKYRGQLFPHNRMIPAPIGADALRGVNLLLSTHAHSDHLDPGSVGTIMTGNPDCRLVCPATVVPTALARGADPARTVGMKAYAKQAFGPVSLELLPSAHEELRVSSDGNTACGGYVIETAGMRLYHSGDCIPFAGLAELLRERRVDAAFLPVNGRTEWLGKHGILGNFTVEEAAELCLAAGIGVLIPHHFGLFDFNTVPSEEIARRLEGFHARGLVTAIPDTEHILTLTPQRK